MARTDELRTRAVEMMIALAENEFSKADAYFHPHAVWWIIGQGELPHSRVRELAHETEGKASSRKLKILGTVAEGNKVSVEAVGRFEYPDGKIYANTYHHVIEFDGDLVISMHEYFDTAYVHRIFGEDLYEKPLAPAAAHA